MSLKRPGNPRSRTSYTMSSGTQADRSGAHVFLLALCLAGVFVPILYREIFTTGLSDYPQHGDSARLLLEGQGIRQPHFLYPVVVAATQLVLASAGIDPGDYRLASLVVTFGSTVLLALLLYGVLRRQVTELSAIALTMSLLLASHIPAYALLEKYNYVGYIGMNVYHNPTVAALKPFALLSFLIAGSLFGSKAAPSATLAMVFAAASVNLISALTKPSYALCLLPVLCAYACWAFLKRQPVDRRLLMAGFVIPIVAVLGWQFWYEHELTGEFLVLAPFAAATAYTHPALIPAKLLLSSLFPLVVTLAYLPQVRINRRMQMAWSVYGVGLLLWYLFAESGRVGHGNVAWGAQVALFVLYVESLLFLLAQKPGVSAQSSGAKLRAAVFAYGLHLVSGLYYYTYVLVKADYM